MHPLIFLQYLIATAITFAVTISINKYNLTNDVTQYLYPSAVLLTIVINNLIDNFRQKKIINEKEIEYENKIKACESKWMAACKELSLSDDDAIFRKITDSQNDHVSKIQQTVADTVGLLMEKKEEVLRLQAKIDALSIRNKEMVDEVRENNEHADYLTQELIKYYNESSDVTRQLRELSKDFQRELINITPDPTLLERLTSIHERMHGTINDDNPMLSVLLTGVLTKTTSHNRKRNHSSPIKSEVQIDDEQVINGSELIIDASQGIEIDIGNNRKPL